MAKKKAKSKGRGAKRPTIFNPPQIDVGRTVEVGVKSAREGETVFTLTDGTKIHAKVMAPSILRSLDKYNPTGDPIYVVQAGVLLKTVVPKRLRKKIKP